MAKRNPLNHRFLRELRTDFGKYFVIFLMMVMTIGFVSGFLVADNSMIKAYNDSFETYNIEHGHFRVRNELNQAQIRNIRQAGASVYELFYTEIPLDNGGKMRIFPERTEVNLVCLMQGSFPKKEDEIVIDRMYADNNHLSIGDSLSGNGYTWTISGLAAFSDYSALYENNSDSMFDAVMFTVAQVTPDGFERLRGEGVYHQYAWKYFREPKDRMNENQMAEEFLKELHEIAVLEDYVPRYMNQAIIFTGDDMGGDKVMIEILLYIIIVIIAFVFSVTINDTIRKESSVIGTLLASGYTRGELLVHYMTLPMAVTAVAALIGNILGYTVMKNLAAAMYYGSYSLPTYVTVWNADAFVRTTIIPLIIIVLITGGTLFRRLKISPLRFLRRDISRRRKSRAFYLPHPMPIMSRVRLRVIFQNAGSYIVLSLGILFANLLLMFGMQLPKLLDHFEKVILENQIASYQTILKLPLSLSDPSSSKVKQMMEYMKFQEAVSTDDPTAEKFSVYNLQTPEAEGIRRDSVMLYGISDHSKYVGLDFSKKTVYISSAFAEKYELSTGDVITLSEEYEDKNYTFRIDGIADYMAGIAVFMPMKQLNQTFGYEDDMFAGYFSAEKITDIDQEYVSTVIDLDAMTKLSRQLNVSFGGMMYLIDGFAVLMYMLLIYLLSCMIIEKNAVSISLTRILGFTGQEISKIYIRSTSIIVVLSMVLSIPVLAALMIPIFTVMMKEMMSGWFPIRLDPLTNLEMILIGLFSYGIIAMLEMRKIRDVKMEEALKHVE